MKNLIKYFLFAPALLLNVASAHAVGTPTVYGIHTPIETNLGGLEWIFVLASLVFLMGLLLVVNGRTLKNRLEQ